MYRFFQDSFIFGETISSHFFRVTTSTQQLLFRSSYFFSAVPFLRRSFFRTVTYLQQSFFSEYLLLENRWFFRAFTFAEELLFQKANFRKSNIPHCLLFQNSYFLIVATFLKELTFLKDFTFHSNYFFQKSYFFRRDTISQLRFFFTATLPIYQLVIK